MALIFSGSKILVTMPQSSCISCCHTIVIDMNFQSTKSLEFYYAIDENHEWYNSCHFSFLVIVIAAIATVRQAILRNKITN
jgi:hypothetical protein